MDIREELLQKFQNRFADKKTGKMRPVDPSVVFNWLEINIPIVFGGLVIRKKREKKIKLSDYTRSIEPGYRDKDEKLL